MAAMTARLAANTVVHEYVNQSANNGAAAGKDGHEYINQSVVDAHIKVVPTSDGGARL